MVVKIKKGLITKKHGIKRKLKFENYKNCLEATQLDNKMKYLEKNKINKDSLKKIIKNSKETINDKKSTAKVQK